MKPAEPLTAAADSSPESWGPLLQQASEEVFEMMLGCRVELRNPPAPAPFEFTAMVGLAGQLCGRFTLRSSKQSAGVMACKMLGVQLNHDEPQIWDAMGEIANMIAGNFKNKLVGLENRCLLSLPTVISGSDYKCRAMKNSYLLEVALLFEGAPLTVAVEVHSYPWAELSRPSLGNGCLLLPNRGYTPLPLIFWNHGVRARLGAKSLRNKDLHVKYSGIKTYLA